MTDDLIRSLEDDWARLDEQESDHLLISLDTATSTPNGPVRLGRDSLGRHLLLPLAQKERRTFKPDVRSVGVRLVLRAVETNESLQWFADLACTDRQLASAFSALCADVILRMEQNPVAGAEVAFRVLNEWRALLASGDAGLGPERLAGLFGELWTLRELTTKDPAAVSAWVGPTGARHDFRQGGTAVEVKTTTAGDASKVWVHGLDQLEAPTGGWLGLCFVRLEAVPTPTLTFNRLLAELKAITSDPALFTRRLRQSGFRESDEREHGDLGFDVLESQWFEVGTEFPRIVAASLLGGAPPAGVTDFHYAVDLGAASHCTLESDEAIGRALS